MKNSPSGDPFATGRRRFTAALEQCIADYGKRHTGPVKALAEGINVSDSVIRRWRREASKSISAESVRRVAAFYGRTPEQMWGTTWADFEARSDARRDPDTKAPTNAEAIASLIRRVTALEAEVAALRGAGPVLAPTAPDAAGPGEDGVNELERELAREARRVDERGAAGAPAKRGRPRRAPGS